MVTHGCDECGAGAGGGGGGGRRGQHHGLPAREGGPQSGERPGSVFTLLIFGTKCEGKFVHDNRLIHVATEHVQCTGLGWWESWDTI